jgi:hypothetical protein
MNHILTTAKVSAVIAICATLLVLAPIAGIEVGMMISQLTAK